MSSVKAVAAVWAKGWPAIAAEQKVIQNSGGFIHRRKGDFITSKVIPLGLSLAATALLVPGIFNMILGRNKIEEA